MTPSSPQEFVLQAAWAKRLGVSTTTFRKWRALGLIPLPVDLPGYPRWSVETVERVTAQIKVQKRGLFRRREASFQPVPSRRVKRDRAFKGSDVSPQDVGVVHADSIAEPATTTPYKALGGGCS